MLYQLRREVAATQEQAEVLIALCLDQGSFIVLAEPASSNLAEPRDGNGVASRALAQMLTNATRMVGRRLHPEMLAQLDSIKLARQSKNSLVVIAMNLADHLQYARDSLGDGRA
jgi:hypothetical protein